MDRFERFYYNIELVQIYLGWQAYPMDFGAIKIKLLIFCKAYPNCSILTGYESCLKLLKQGADIWLNLPLLLHEASSTSGMTAAMNGTVNVVCV
jgi:starch phosphorylase